MAPDEKSLTVRASEASQDAYLAIPTKPSPEVEMYKGASMLVITPEESSKILEATKEESFEVHPSGFIYLPQIFVREKLNQTFGVGQWALIQVGLRVVDKTMCYDGMLFVRGHFISRAIGEADYIESNDMSSWATVTESAKSDCLTRCCKDLGIAREAWQPQFTSNWLERYAVTVYRTSIRRGQGGWQWRRKTAKPFDDEDKYSELNNKASRVNNAYKLKIWWNECLDNVNELSTKQKQLLGQKYNEMNATYKESDNGGLAGHTETTTETKPTDGKLFTDSGEVQKAG